jgi:antitoxin component YwqK of YwqJK toxin-antitoxin module
MNPLPFILLAISLPLLLGGCGEKEVPSSQLVTRQYITYLVNSEKPFTGKSYELYPNGQKLWEVNFKDGKPDGLYVEWYENGQKRREANYKHGKEIYEKYWNSKGEPVDSQEEAK